MPGPSSASIARGRPTEARSGPQRAAYLRNEPTLIEASAGEASYLGNQVSIFLRSVKSPDVLILPDKKAFMPPNSPAAKAT